MNQTPEALPPESFPQDGSFNQVMLWYEKQPWIRAVVQAIPVAGGPADTLLAWRGTYVNQKRVEELFRRVTGRLSQLAESAISREYLASDEFFEILRTCVEAVARAADAQKRKIVADYLASSIERGVFTDLSQQIAEDLKVLQPLHLQIIATLPQEPNVGVNLNSPLVGLEEMNVATYRKGLADLERLGFIRFDISIFTSNTSDVSGPPVVGAQPT